MKTCLTCQQPFKTVIKIDGQWKFLSSRKYCLTCSPFGAHITRPPKIGLKIGYRRCTGCQKDLPVSDFWKRSPTTYNSRCKKCLYKYQEEKKRQMKQDAVIHKGGKCIKCGYDKCLDALDFHHIDPTQKEYDISWIIHNTKKKTLMQELEKCQLLCSNCHREQHSLQETHP